MKRIIFYLSIMALVSCEVKQEESKQNNINPPAGPDDTEHLSFIVRNVDKFKLEGDFAAAEYKDDNSMKWEDFGLGVTFMELSGTNDDEYLEYLENLSKHMTEVSVEYGWDAFYTVFYDTYITDVTIVSETPLFGRDSMEDLTDCFKLYGGAPLFSYPDANLMNGEEARKFIEETGENLVYYRPTYSIKDYIEQKCFSTNGLSLSVADEYAHYKHEGTITFKISVSWANGAQATGEFTATFY